MRLAALVLCVALTSACGLALLPNRWSEVATVSSGCDYRLWEHTYSAERRLATVATCIVVEGIVRDTHMGGDGDLIIELETDLRLVNSSNVNGWLKVEAVCQAIGTKRKHRKACRGYPGPIFTAPPLGSKVRVTGRYVSDRNHGGHMEVHPLSRLE